MTLFFNDYEVDAGFTTADVGTALQKTTESLNGGSWSRVNRGTSADREISLSFTYAKTDVNSVIENLEAICANNSYVLIRSTDQDIWGVHKAVYVKVDRFTPSRPPGFTYFSTMTITGNVVGVPAKEGGDAVIGNYWSMNPVAPSNVTSAYFPWSRGGRNGLNPSTVTPGSWVANSGNNVSIVTGTGVTFAMTKVPDGTQVMRATGTAASTDSYFALAQSNAYQNGYFSVRFRVNAFTANSHNIGLLTRLSSLLTTSNGYMLRVALPTTLTGNGTLQLWTKTSATYVTIGASATVDTPGDGNWHSFGILWVGTTYTCFYDGQALINGVDATTNAAGYMGFRFTDAGASGGNVIDVADIAYGPFLQNVNVPVPSNSYESLQIPGARTEYMQVGPNLLGNWETQNWTGYTSGTVNWDTGVFRSGTQSLRVGGSATGRGVRVLNFTGLIPGKTYVFEAWTKTSGALGTGNYFVWFDQTNYEVNGSAVDTVVTPNAWVKNSIVFRPRFPESVNGATVALASLSSGNVYWDDLSIRECVPIIVHPKHGRVVSSEVIS